MSADAAQPPPRDGPAGDKPDHDALEIVATVILGLAVLAIAWSSLQSSLWGGEQATATTQSVLTSDEANDLFQQADGIKTLDQILFVDFLTNCTSDDVDASDDYACEQIVGNMSEPGQEAFAAWAEEEDQFLPFETDEYNDTIYGDAEAGLADSDALFAEAGDANTNGDRYETAASSLAMVLFFAGISLVIGWVRLRWVLLGIAAVILVWAGVYLAGLPTV